MPGFEEDQTRKVIDSLLLGTLVDTCNNNASLVACLVLTGSYARGALNLRRPSINAYFVSRPNAGVALRLKVMSALDDLEAIIATEGFDLLVDCHPYTVPFSRPLPPHQRRLSLTTKVLDSCNAHIRFSLPPTIGVGWLQAYKVLWGNAATLEALKLESSTDTEWFQAIHEALGRYLNILDHLPWTISPSRSANAFAEESIRYAEEAAKDLIAVLLPLPALRSGEQFAYLHDWPGLGRRLIESHLGAEGKALVDKVIQMKEALDQRHEWSPAASIETWQHAVQIVETVWTVFRKRMADECPQQVAWITRINKFV